MRSRVRGWVFALATLAIGVLLALLAGELALRLAGFEVPQFYQYDAELGVRHRPGAEGVYRGEGEAPVHINSAGFRSREIARSKPANTLRVLVLGDSFAEAFGVPLDQVFTSVAERELAACPAAAGRRVELLNMGVSGYGTSTEWVALQREGWAFDPDIVVLAFFSGNDLRNNVPELEQKPYRLYHRLQNGRLEPYRPAGAVQAAVHGALTQAWRGLANVSRLAQVVNQGRRWWVEAELRARGREITGAAAAGIEEGIDTMVLSAPRDPAWQQAWDVTEAVLAAMAGEVRQHGRQFQIATVSNAIQVHPDAAVRRAFMDRLGLADLGYAENRVAALAQRLGVPVTPFAPPLLQWAQQQGRCVHGLAGARPCFGHWNADGHRIAGEVLARDLCARLPVPPGPQ